MGKFLIFCRIQLKFCSWLYKKRWHTSWKFQFEKTSNTKVITKKPLTNLYEMNSRICLYVCLFAHVLLCLCLSVTHYIHFGKNTIIFKLHDVLSIYTARVLTIYKSLPRFHLQTIWSLCAAFQGPRRRYRYTSAELPPLWLNHAICYRPFCFDRIYKQAEKTGHDSWGYDKHKGL